jgi:hypothetical protein
VDIRNDQWYYFGPYNESNRIFRIIQIGRIMNFEMVMYFLFLLIILLTINKINWRNRVVLIFLGLNLYLAGAVATIGGHYEPEYFWPFKFYVISSIIIIVLENIQIVKNKDITSQIIASLITVQLISAILISGFTILQIKSENKYYFDQKLGGFLPKEYKQYLDFISKIPKNSMIEEYYGLASAYNMNMNGSKTDSVISALGKYRLIFKKESQDKEYIITTRNKFDEVWQPWSLTQNYWFYENLFRDYSIVYTGPSTLIWKKNKSSRIFNNIDCAISPKGESFYFEAKSKEYYEVELYYNYVGKNRVVIGAENNINQAGFIGGFVSLDPNNSMLKFPVFTHKNGNNIKIKKVIGQSPQNLIFIKCFVKEIPEFSQEVLPRNI